MALGGVHNQFTFINDSLNGFHNQHDIRSLGNGSYSLFDNGNLHEPPCSRALVYRLDLEAKTASLVWEYRNPDAKLFSTYMGSHQKLPYGNSLINWAVSGLSKATEVTPAGEVVYEMDFIDDYHTYRTFRFPWNGIVESPNLILEPADSSIILLFNKFGDKDVAYYNIYADSLPSPTTLFDTSKTTMKCVKNFKNDRTYFFCVSAVSKSGVESACSQEKSIFINFRTPGDNMVVNSDFSKEKHGWQLKNYGSTNATWMAETQEGHISIAYAGNDIQSIAFYQDHMSLKKESEYVLEFDARADSARLIEVMVCRSDHPEVNYSMNGLTALTARMKHYSYSFSMQHYSDFEAELRFHVGGDEKDVYIDNVVLCEKTAVSVRSDKGNEEKVSTFRLLNNYPNPFNWTTTIRYLLQEKSDVIINIYSVLGQRVATVINEIQPSGSHNIQFSASQLSSGIYFYELCARPIGKTKTCRIMGKMMVVK